jgi:hypothetical protein
VIFVFFVVRVLDLPSCMHRVVVALLLVLSAAPAAQVPTRPLQADAVVKLLADLEAALESGQLDACRALTSPTLPADHLHVFERALAGGVSAATVRERTRRPIDENGFEVLAEVLVSRGRVGRLATWLLTVRPGAGAVDRDELAGIVEPASIDGLVKLTLDATKQYALHDFTFRAPDLTLTMASGTAFVAEDAGGITAVVLRGRGELRFAPPDPAEQGQLKVFAGRPSYETPLDTAFIRLDSAEFAKHVSEHSLTAGRVDPGELARARSVFDEMSTKTYHLDLHDLTRERWSFPPPLGSAIVEFKTRRFGWLTYARAPSEAEDITLFDRARGHNLSLYRSADRLAARGPSYSEDDDAPYDVERYGVDLTFDPERAWISGRGSVVLKIKAASAGTVTLRLAESLAVSSVSSPSFGPLLALRVIGQNSLMVTLPTAVPRGSEFPLEVVYSGRLAPQRVDRELAAPAGQTRDAQNPPLLVLEPEPRYLYSSQVDWYPQAPVTDYATAAMRLHVPAEYQVIASGTLTRSSVAAAEGTAGLRGNDARFVRTVEYAADRPVPSLACVISRFVPTGRLRVDVPAVSPSARDAAGGGLAAEGPAVINLEVVSTPRMASQNRQLPARVADIMKVYAGLVGEAPYPDFTVAGIDDNLPGGHSPPFFAIWLQPLPSTPYSWLGDPLAVDHTYPFFFLAHEVAHQWWGQAVGSKNYHEQWLSEGLAHYFATLYAGTDRGPDMVRQLIGQMRDSALAYSANGPIALSYRLGHIQGDTRIFRALVYNKSAVVLHMLRQLIGDDAFFKGLRRYYRACRFGKAGTDDLRVALEAETPIRLSRFFERWIAGASLPRLRVTSRLVSDASGASAIVRIDQIGDVFDLPVTVTVQYADGRSADVTIPVTEAVVEHRIPLQGPLRRIVTREELTLASYVK